MANKNPWQARLKRHAKHWPVPIETLEAEAYAVLMLAYEGVAVEDAEQRRKNILCYFQGVLTLAKLRDAREFEARLAAIESLLHQRPEVSPNGKY